VSGAHVSADPVTIVEVAPRDGLQSETTMLGTQQKVELIRRAATSGLRRVEAVSFVNPKRVPQMADADDVMAALLADPTLGGLGTKFIGLVLNERGLDRAVAAGVHEVNVVVVCTDTFAERNQNRTTFELADSANRIVTAAREQGIATSVTLAASFGCPFEGEVPEARLADVVGRVLDGAPDEIALADSIGVAVPSDVTAKVRVAADVIGAAGTGTALRCHFHNTRNTGLANAVAAVEAGVRVLDSSLGGIGGCPFAPNATGNIPTEDLIYLLHRMGYDTGVDLDALCRQVDWLEGELGHRVPGLLAKAGGFPANAA